MAGKGPPPKPQRNRQRDNRRSATPETNGTRSRPLLPDAKEYSEATRRWYKTWRESKQAERFTATDWQRLHMLAPLIEAYFKSPTKDLLGEIRLNEAKLGATPEDRLRLHWPIEMDNEPNRPHSKPRTRKDPRRT